MILVRVYKNTTWSVYKNITRNIYNYFKYQLSLNNRISYCAQLSISKLKDINCTIKHFSIDKNYGGFDNTKNNSDEYLLKKFSEKDLYSYTKDEILISMKPLVNVKQILEHFNIYKHQYNSQTYVQALQKLWLNQDLKENNDLFSQFNMFLENMSNYINEMNIDESTYCLFYLTKLDICSDNLVVKNLYFNILNFLDVKDNISLPNLSRFSYSIYQKNGFYKPSVCNKILEHLQYHLKYCEDSECLHLITTSLYKIIPHITHNVLKNYIDKVNYMLLLNKLNDSNIKYILKIANFLCFPKWSSLTANISRDLLVFLFKNYDTNQMDSTEIEMTFKLFQSILEPAEILPKLLIIARKDFINNTDNLEILASVANFDQKDRKNLFDQANKIITKKMLQTEQIPNLSTIYKLLRSLKISDLTLCDLYWSNVLKEINKSEDALGDLQIMKYCFRYMFFNNNLGGTFRHLKFELLLSELVMKNINEKQFEENHSKFARLASFVIAYGAKDNSNVTTPEFIITKIESMKDMFSIYDCLILSKGFQIASELRFRYKVPKDDIQKLNRIETILKHCVRKFLDKDKHGLNKINSIVRILNNMKVETTSELYLKAIDLYKYCSVQLDSRCIREISFNLLASNYMVSDIMKHCFDYINKNKNYVLGDTVQKVLHTAYTLAYIPEHEHILHWSAEIINRDFNFMTPISIVQACLALCFYRVLPPDLVQKVFNPEFIKRIEIEIELCYSKQTYPDRILNQVMQLNRAICLDYPEIQMPWFQQNYIEAQLSKKTIVQSKLSNEVQKILYSIIKNKKDIFINPTTPYGYTIDFVVHLNPSHNLLNHYDFDSNVSKFAILLLKKDAYCKNENSNIKGFEHMRIRHLEMLGFIVIHLNVTDWYALHMNIPGAKTIFLRKLLKLC